MDLSSDDMRELLECAAVSVVETTRGIEPTEWPTQRFEERGGGVFVTLRREGELVGCVGYVTAPAPLTNTVSQAAHKAACEDRRFSPVAANELPALSVEVSVLTELEPIAPDDVRIGRHGLVLRQDANEGLLLPQVAIEHDLDREGFLRAVCDKARVLPDAWRDADTELFAFEARLARAELRDLVELPR